MYPHSEKVTDVIRWQRSRKPQLEELTAMLRSDGLECTLYADTPGTKYARHKHDFDDFIVIVSGQMKIGIDLHEWVLKPGDRLDLPANTIHWAEVVGREEVKYLSAAK
jgi:quercetin dioxygenase-like cupin family protein